MSKDVNKGFGFIRGDIQERIEKMAQLDYNVVSIEEILTILSPLFEGYRVMPPQFESGTYIYRGRVCIKPDKLKQLTYPPPDSVFKLGRVNDIGESIFYGSIGKNVPFFEISSLVGDRIALSLWKSKSRFLLNHMGYSEESFAEMDSLRKVDKLHKFLEEMEKYGDLNKFIYNYFSRCFTEKILSGEENNYKLTIAIAKKLMMGSPFVGIMYPTIAMFANADNIALKPDFVDDNLEFVAVEYLEITKIENLIYSVVTLDSASEIDNDGNILWSGRALGWRVVGPNKTDFKTNGLEWIATNSSGERVDPISTTLIRKNIGKIETEFGRDFLDSAGINYDLTIRSVIESIIVKASLRIDFNKKEKFLVFYIPECFNPESVCEQLATSYDEYIAWDKDIEMGAKYENDGVDFSSKNFTDSKLIYFYSETFVNEQILRRKVSNKYGIVIKSNEAVKPTIRYSYKEKGNN